MRFRAKLADIGCIQHFTRVVGTVSKLAKSCILRITSNKLYFILSEKVGNGGVSIWCELIQSHFFNEFNMDGVSEEANEIYLEIIPESLLRCLKSAQNAKSVKIKLTKKHTPCLTFEIELPSVSSHSRVVVHDVPVSLIPCRLWADYDEPGLPDFDVSLYMPSLKVVRSVVDKMKNLSNFLIVSVNQNGEMKLKVETDLATVSTHFSDLQKPVWVGATEQNPVQNTGWDPMQFAETRIDIKRFAQFLLGQQVNPLRVICNIVNHQVAHFFMLHEDVSLQYFMPQVSA